MTSLAAMLIARGARLGLGPEIPDVHDLLVGRKGKGSVNGMGSAQNDDIGARQGLLQGNQRRVLHVRIGAQHFAGLDFQQFAQLVGKAVAHIVGITLEGHAQDRHALLASPEGRNCATR